MKHKKKLIVTLLTLMLMTAAFTLSAQAAPKVPKSQTFHLQPSPFNKKGSVYGTIMVSQGKDSGKIVKSSVKSSKKKIVKITYVNDNFISYTVQKPGTATISFKIGKKKYQTKIYGKKYANPVKTVSITGIKNGNSTNLAGLTNKSVSSTRLKLEKTVHNPKVHVVAKKGWKIQEIIYMNAVDSGSKKYKKPFSKATTSILKKNKTMKAEPNRIEIVLVNTKSKDTIRLQYNVEIEPQTEFIS